MFEGKLVLLGDDRIPLKPTSVSKVVGSAACFSSDASRVVPTVEVD